MFSLKAFINRIDVGVRMIVALTILLALTVAIGVVGYTSLSKTSNESQHALLVNSRAAVLASRVAGQVADLRRFEKDVFLNVTAAAKVAEYEKKWAQGRADANTNLTELQHVIESAEEADRLRTMSEQLAAYDTGFHTVIAGIASGKITSPEAGNEAIAPYKDGIRALETAAAALAQSHSEDIAAVPAALEDRSRGAMRVLLICGALALFAGIVISRIVSSTLSETRDALSETRVLKDRIETDNAELQSNIMDLLQVVSDASDGNLTVRAPITAGALGNVADAFNSLMEAQQHILTDVYQQVDQTTSAVQEIQRASREMADGATNQASGVQAAQDLVQKMSTEIARVSDGASRAVEAARRTEESAAEGTNVVQNVISGMGTLRANVQAGAKKMKNLGDRSLEITTIVGTINSISERTNMLALNAAIEAARAGEHGRGFSVVAEEVRKLAERTATATQEIGRLVQSIHTETNETVGAIEEQTQVVEQESALVGQAGESLIRIRKVSAESAAVVVDISRVAQAQAKETTTVVRTMDEISAIARATQRGAEATVTTVVQLSQLSNKLQSAIQRFKVA
ncbi:MAG TPA: methyl-accepting chemotaxis protein [Polyangiaceae bacterium]|jgi:methyl-accepting chemotaxis protein|nr:methyl-accepting chemotaxis protein [Polyangiaceae bacterium]